MSDPYCSAGEYTPGGLMDLYGTGYDDYGSWDELELGLEKLNEEINYYTMTHPNYHSSRDPYLRFSIGNNRRLRYKDLRLQYWEKRAQQSEVCSNQFSCGSAADKLFSFYDEHESVTIIEAVPDSVNWDSVALDAVGIPISLVGAKGPIKLTTPFGKKYGYNLLFLAGVSSSSVDLADSVSKGNPVRAVLDIGTYVPVAGAFFSFTLLIGDLQGEMREVPWVPPIDQ
jgi:hypothetical protein